MINIATILTIAYLIYDVCGIPLNNEPLVHTSQGSIRGTVMITRKNRKVAAFRGIPYAEPPIGDLRFRDPVPKRPWNGTLNAIADSSECAQVESTQIPIIYGKEDCLYLNVFTPQLHSTNEILPVMVYIHGGAFVIGNGSSINFGPQYLLDKNVVLVTINYRLSILGFLSTGDEVAPGNFGLKDQTLALEWVQKHIKAFGGNPKMVTLFGISAGSASVNLHAFSDRSKGLFHRYILQSGSALAPWAVRNVTTYSAFATQMGILNDCPTVTSLDLILCLRNLSLVQLLLTSAFPIEIEAAGLTWGPTSEPDIPNAFLTDRPINLLHANKLQDVRFISGHTRDEVIMAVIGLYVDHELCEYVINNLYLIIEAIASIFLPQVNASSFAKDVMQFYFNDVPSPNRDVILSQLVVFLTDMLYFYPEWVFLQYQAKHASSPFYSYSFEYRGTLGDTLMATNGTANIGVSHGDDEIYLTPMDLLKYKEFNLRMSDTDFQMVDTMVNFWTSFASNGSPTAENLVDPTIWKPYVSNSNYLQIGNDSDPSVTSLNNLHETRMEFWNQRVSL